MDKTIDERFDEVTHAFGEQRDFTLFCFDKLRGETRDGFKVVDLRLDKMDQRMDKMDQRFDAIEQRLDVIEGRLAGHDCRLEGIDRRLARHEGLLGEILHEVKALSRRIP